MKEKEEKGIDVENWEKFLKKLENLRQEHRKRESSQKPPPSSPLLFRGQENSCWQLETTLERNGQKEMGVNEYFGSIVGTAKPQTKSQIESFTGVNWDVPDDHEIKELLEENDPFDPAPLPRDSRKRLLLLYRYMTYLRHFGFPSPLLDWTSSPYIAAFFAFRRAAKRAEKVSIYVYRKAPEGSASNSPISVFGQPTGTHRRHFRQQCWYTICTVKEQNEWRFASHEDAVARGDPQQEQDVVSKFNIPSKERIEVLKLLDNDYNLNASSLFASEESLMETMALRALDFPKRNS